MITLMGATGHVGSRIAENLLERGHAIRVIGRSADRLNRFRSRGAEIQVGDALNGDFLIRAFRGAEIVFTMIPPNMSTNDPRGFQNRIGGAITRAIDACGVKKIVNLSSQGAELREGTGLILGLHDQEERLKLLRDVDVLHLRAACFMENLLAHIPSITHQGAIAEMLFVNHPVNMVATRDIADVATNHLINRQFEGIQYLGVMGPHQITMHDVTALLARALGRHDLRYIELSPDEGANAMVTVGISPEAAHAYSQLVTAVNDGIIKSTGAAITGPTTLAEFIADTFVPAYVKATQIAPRKRTVVKKPDAYPADLV